MFVKMNDEPIEIETVVDEHEERNDYKPSFWYWGRRYFLEDFIRTHNNPWLGCSEFPEYIHGVQADVYFRPIFIELIGDEFVNVYEEREEE